MIIWTSVALEQGCPNFLPGGPHVVIWTSMGAAHSDQYKKCNNNGNNSNDNNNNNYIYIIYNNNNKCKKVYECFVFILLKVAALGTRCQLFFFFLQTPFLIRAKVGRKATQEKKKERKELSCDQRYYTHIHVIIMSMVATQLFFFFLVEHGRWAWNIRLQARAVFASEF